MRMGKFGQGADQTQLQQLEITCAIRTQAAHTLWCRCCPELRDASLCADSRYVSPRGNDDFIAAQLARSETVTPVTA